MVTVNEAAACRTGRQCLDFEEGRSLRSKYNRITGTTRRRRRIARETREVTNFSSGQRLYLRIRLNEVHAGEQSFSECRGLLTRPLTQRLAAQHRCSGANQTVERHRRPLSSKLRFSNTQGQAALHRDRDGY